jgi:acyl-CoA thioester hydrolase
MTVEQIKQLPFLSRVTITEDYLDAMGHMNVRWYLSIFDDADWHLFEKMGMSLDYYKENQAGGFALTQHLRYLAEVHKGETVAIYGRVLGRSAKRLHVMLFMVNETRDVLAATLEGLGSHADLSIRRTSPYPPFIAEKIDAMLAEHTALGWDAPICGAIKP